MYLYAEKRSQTRIIKGELFPQERKKSSANRYRALIGVGGNLGDVKRRFNHLWYEMERSPLMEPLQSGIILENPPFGYENQPSFFNTVIEIATSLNPRALLRALWRMEHRFGRVRSFANAPRTLDLDIIFFDQRRISYPELSVPHPSFRERQSVMIPLRSLRSNIWFRGRNNR